MEEVLLKDYIEITIIGEIIPIIFSDTAYGRSTVAEINGQYYYLGNELSAISAAIFTWQEVYGMELSAQEIHDIMAENKLIPGVF